MLYPWNLDHGKCSINVCWMAGLLPFPSFLEDWLTRFLFSPGLTLNLGDFIIPLIQHLTLKFFDISSSDLQLNFILATLKRSDSLDLSSSKSLPSWNIKCIHPTPWTPIPVLLPLSALIPLTSVFQYYRLKPLPPNCPNPVLS